jgi:hypothetical protein
MDDRINSRMAAGLAARRVKALEPIEKVLSEMGLRITLELLAEACEARPPETSRVFVFSNLSHEEIEKRAKLNYVRHKKAATILTKAIEYLWSEQFSQANS